MRFAFALLALCSVCQPADLARATELYQRTEYRQALALLQPSKSNDAAELALAGRSAFMLGDFKQSATYLERATQLDPRRSEYFHWLGKAYGRRAETSSFLTAPKWAVECRKAFEKAVELNPGNVEALSDLMEFYLEAPGFLGGGQDKAANVAHRIGAVDPVERHFAEARVAEKKKEYSAAEHHLRKAAEMAPEKIHRVVDLAKFLARRGKIQESETVFRRAQQVAPDDPSLLFGRAEVYVESNRNLEEARQLLERYLALPGLTPDDPSQEEAKRLLRRTSGG